MDNANNVPQASMSDQNQNTQNTSNQNNKIMGVLAYLSILVLIPLLSNNKSAFMKFHTNQGLVLLIVNIVGQIVLSFLHIWMLTPLLSLAVLILAIMGIVHVVNNEMTELPVIGGWKILK